MRILLANPRAFCAGVEMAIASVERALSLFGTPLFVYHEIVHNAHVIEQFKNRGVTFVNDLEQVPVGSRLLFSAHGIAPLVREQAGQRNLHTIDATCPLVAKVHLEAIRYLSQGYSVILIGHAGHDEVVGTLGEGRGRIQLLETSDDVDRVSVPNPEKVAYLTQTTLSVDEAKRIIDLLKLRFPAIVGPARDDICYATQNRQEALKALLPRADVTLVLGSRNSSNSNRLVEIARETGKPAYLIDGCDELDPRWFRGDESVLITAGASAPEELVQQCVSDLKHRFQAEVEEHALRSEAAFFPLPVELRDASPAPPGAARHSPHVRIDASPQQPHCDADSLTARK